MRKVANLSSPLLHREAVWQHQLQKIFFGQDLLAFNNVIPHRGLEWTRCRHSIDIIIHSVERIVFLARQAIVPLSPDTVHSYLNGTKTFPHHFIFMKLSVGPK